jgi:uncharacterized protein with PIN domain
VVIDTSTVLAWLKQEPERGRIVTALEAHSICRISAVSLIHLDRHSPMLTGVLG